METLYPSCFMANNSDWFVQDLTNTEWTKEENKRFESALAIYDKDTPDRWLKVASMIPGKTVYHVIKQYKELVQDIGDIEAGRVPVPLRYDPPSSFAFHIDANYNYRKRPFKACDQDRKKGVPWTEEEHRRFLMGLMKYGKGDWRNISRNFVVTKTPTQVASHAQKYYIRQKLSGGNNNNNNSNNNNNNKRRPSIHDITILNLTQSSNSEDNKPLLFNHKSNDAVFNFNPNCDFLRSSSSSKNLKLQEQDLYHIHDSALHDQAYGYTNKASVLGIHAL